MAIDFIMLVALLNPANTNTWLHHVENFRQSTCHIKYIVARPILTLISVK